MELMELYMAYTLSLSLHSSSQFLFNVLLLNLEILPAVVLGKKPW